MATKESYHHGDLRSALIQAGLAVLQEEGLEALTLRRAAREAGVSAAAPYRHFKDKKSLLAAISEDGFRELASMLNESQKKHPGDLNAAGRAYLAFARKETATYRLMFTQKVLCADEVTESLKECSSNAFVSLVQIIDAGIASGKIAPAESVQLALSSWALMHGVAMLVTDGILENGPFESLSPEEILETRQAHFKAGWQPRP